MKKKLALLMAAIMTVAMVPMTAFASTKLTAVDEISAGVGKDHAFESRVELKKNDDQVDVVATKNGMFEVKAVLENGKFTKVDGAYLIETRDADEDEGIGAVKVINDTTAVIELDATTFNGKSDAADACVLNVKAYALEAGDVVIKFTSNVPNFKAASEVIASASTGKVAIESAGVKTFVEDGEDCLKIKDITIKELREDALKNGTITLKLNGDWKFCGDHSAREFKVSSLNSSVDGNYVWGLSDDDEVVIELSNFSDAVKLEDITISGLYLKTTKKCEAGDVATITVKSSMFDSVKLEVAKMVEEAVTYTVEDKELPTIWAGKDYFGENANTLELSIEENTGDILNTSRKATFTFPEGIEVLGIGGVDVDGVTDAFDVDIDENVVTIRNYSTAAESDKTDMDIKFLINAAPTFEGDVTVTLGGEFDDVEFKVATVKAPYTVEAKTSEVLIDYRYVPVNEIVITEAEDGILAEGAIIALAVEKMEFEDAGSFEVTEGDIEVDVNVDELEGSNVLVIEVEDDSTEASTIVISGLELYLDRTLPVGGYALENVGAPNILWENSSDDKDDYDLSGIFKYKEVVVNDSYVEVVTQARDQDDYTTSRKIVITIGAATMAVGTETVALDTPAYINAENYTELPLRAVSEAFGATVAWDDASRTVTVLMGQRIISMTIGSKTMYINGTPVAMNTAPEITNNRTFVPVRDLANALGITKIDWNEAAATVTLN